MAMRNEHRVLTPESVEFTYELAGPGSRLLAVLVDSLMLGVLLLLARVGGLLLFVAAGPLGGLLYFILGFAVSWGYFVLQEWRWNGQTLGKRMLDLRVIDERGFSIDLFQSVIRNLLRAVDSMPFLFNVIGFYGTAGVVALCNPRQKRLGDFAAGTLVVKVRRRVMPSAIMAPNEKYNSLQEDAALRTRIRTLLSLEERDLLLQLCVRRNELALDCRRALFDEAAAYLEERLEVKREAFLSPEKFVQNIAAVALAEAPVRRPGQVASGAVGG
jgi:uncharacterized RDD family membrane protein YckC